MPSSKNNDVSKSEQQITKEKSRFRHWKNNMALGAFLAFTLIFLGLLIAGIAIGSGGAAIPGALAIVVGALASVTGTGIGGGIGIFSALVVAAMALAGGAATLIGGLCCSSESDDLDMNQKPGTLDYNPQPPAVLNQPVHHFGSYDPFYTPNVGITGLLTPSQSEYAACSSSRFAQNG